MARRKLLTKKNITLGALVLGALYLLRRRQQNVAGLGFWNMPAKTGLIWGRPVKRNPVSLFKIPKPGPVQPRAPITTMPVKPSPKPSPISVPISTQPVKPPVRRGLFGRRIRGFTPPAPKRIVGLRFAWGK